MRFVGKGTRLGSSKGGRRRSVVIVGAGPTGISAAILLGQLGVDTLVLDRWADVYPQPRAVHLDDEVYRILGRLGVAQEFATISRPGEGLRLLAADHRVLAQFDRTNLRTSNGFPQANMFDQPDLESLLRSRVKKLPSVEVRGSVEVQSVDMDSDGRPVVEFEDKASGKFYRVSADYLLGCDGANSVVRKAIGSELESLGFEQRWLVVDIESDRELGHWEGVHQVCHSERAATYMRIGSERHRWEFALRDDETTNSFPDLDSVAPLIRQWVADTSELRLLRVAEYTFRSAIADRWHSDRTFILGDAAHLTPPFIGQGMGAGLRDAMNLSWKVAGVLDGSLSPDVLDSYELERKPHARAMIRLATTVGLAMTGGGRTGDALRRTVVPLVSHLPGLKGRVVDSATPRLSASALVRRTRRPRDPAGTLCPNVELGAGERFDQVLAGRFALVTKEGLDQALISGLGSSNVAVVPVEAGSQLNGWLRNAGVTTALVRPDGTVAAAGRGTAAVLAAVPSVHVSQFGGVR